MQFESASFGIVTDNLQACREFYVGLGLEIVSDHGWYVQLRSPNQKLEIGLLEPNQMTVPSILKRPYAGGGSWINLEVDDVDSAFQEAIDRSMNIEMPLREEPWGERHFIVRDPAGLAINVMSKVAVENRTGFLP